MSLRRYAHKFQEPSRGRSGERGGRGEGGSLCQPPSADLRENTVNTTQKSKVLLSENYTPSAVYRYVTLVKSLGVYILRIFLDVFVTKPRF